MHRELANLHILGPRWDFVMVDSFEVIAFVIQTSEEASLELWVKVGCGKEVCVLDS